LTVRNASRSSILSMAFSSAKLGTTGMASPAAS
jgi:hypothetical protein